MSTEILINNDSKKLNNQPIEMFPNDFKSSLEEKKGNLMKPLSMKPNRSLKKNSSLRPQGLKLK